jgi:TolB protein
MSLPSLSGAKPGPLPRGAARIAALAGSAVLAALCAAVLVAGPATRASSPSRTIAPDPREKHLGPLLQLTDGIENAEAYFSFDGRSLVFQSRRPPYGCDQIFTMRTDGTGQRRVSTGKGRTTCSYYLPGDKRILFSSTHLGSDACPPPADMSHGYTWALYPDYDIFVAGGDGSPVERLTTTPGYDAEATVSPKGDRIVFTSMRDGDLDIYTMKVDGSDVRRLTSELGYDGGPFFSPDGTLVVYRAYHPRTRAEIDDYKRLLAKNLIRPTKLEIWVMNADGSGKRQVTNLDAASFAPFFHPSGRKIIFSSNYGDPAGREFDLFMVNLDGTGLERVTYAAGFDGFPIFAPDGKRFVFCSNRHDTKSGETNVFITDWKD